ncbi:MAG: hypothetical protein ACLSU0_04760 [Oscillospiraceae bacterium]
MIKELGELNEKFYQLYGRLHKNKSLLAIKPEQIQYMATALFNQYKAEYKLLSMRAEIRERRALYDTELRHYILVPRKRFIFFRNRAMKQLDTEIIDKLEAWFEQREKNEANGSMQEDLPLGWEEQQRKPETAATEQPAQPESTAADNTAQPAEQAQPDTQEQPEQSAQAAASEQSEQTRSKKRNAAAQVPGQLSLLNG